jgi:uncharacterized protein (DUF427 family)
MWRRMARQRPPAESIVKPGPGQESVWDYPRPPRVEPVAARITVVFAGLTLAGTTRALRVIETAGAPVYYLPREDVRTDLLARSDRWSLCEWKGIAEYWTVRVDEHVAENAAWSYPEPAEGYEPIKDHFAFFPAKVDACYVGDEKASPQPGGFYGGWITQNVVGPFKGEPGSEAW